MLIVDIIETKILVRKTEKNFFCRYCCLHWTRVPDQNRVIKLLWFETRHERRNNKFLKKGGYFLMTYCRKVIFMSGCGSELLLCDVITSDAVFVPMSGARFYNCCRPRHKPSSSKASSVGHVPN